MAHQYSRPLLLVYCIDHRIKYGARTRFNLPVLARTCSIEGCCHYSYRTNGPTRACYYHARLARARWYDPQLSCLVLL